MLAPSTVIEDPRRADSADAIICAQALARHGVVSGEHLLAAGVSRAQITRRIRDGRLHKLHPNVYAVGHPHLTLPARRAAAVLACGRGAVFSHRSAADIHGVRPWSSARFELTIPADAHRGRRLPDFIVHRTTLPADEITHVGGAPVTVISRTMLDLAAVVPADHLDRALERMIELQSFDADGLAAVIARHRRRRGAGRLRDALARLMPEAAASRRELERRALQLVVDHGLPAPRVNALVEGVEVVLFWAASGLVVELDSHAFHTSPRAFERDRRKSSELEARGYRVMRFTWAQVTKEASWVASCIAAVLGAGRAAAGSGRVLLPARLDHLAQEGRIMRT